MYDVGDHLLFQIVSENKASNISLEFDSFIPINFLCFLWERFSLLTIVLPVLPRPLKKRIKEVNAVETVMMSAMMMKLMTMVRAVATVIRTNRIKF